MSTAQDTAGRLIGSAVEHVTRRPVLTAVTVLGLAAAGLYYAAENLGINTDTANMISPELEWRQDFIAYRDSFPVRDRNIVAVIDGPDNETVASYARDLAAALEQERDRFPSVFLAGYGEFFEQNGLLYLPLDDLERLADRLIDAQPLLGRLANDVSGAGVLAVLSESIERDAALPAAQIEDLDRIFREIGVSLAAANNDASQPVAWGRLIGIDTDTSTRQLLLVRPALDFDRVRPARDAIERIRAIAADLAGAHSNLVDLRLTGTLAMEDEELTSIVRSASAAGLAALATVMIVLLWALKSVRLLIVAVITLLAGLSLTAAFAALTVGQLNLLSVAFAVLYVGLGVDFILHLCLRLKEICVAGVNVGAGLVKTARGVGSSLLICAVTTAVAFFAFIPTDFDGISELGLISGGGMIISFFVSLSLLPALIKLFWRGEVASRPHAGQTVRRWRFPALPPRITCAAAAIIALIGMALLPGLRFDGNPIHLRDPDAESIRALEDLAADSDAPLFNLAVLVPDAAAAAMTAQALSALGTVERVQTVASLVPADQDDKLFVIDDMALLLGSTLAEFNASPPDSLRLVVELERLADALSRLDARTGSQDALLEQAELWLTGNRLRASQVADARAAALDRDIRGNLIDQIGRLAQGLGAQGFGRNDLPAELRDRWVNAAGQELVEVVPNEDLNNNEAARRFVAAVRTVAPNATGLPVVYEEAAATVTRAFTLALTYAFVVVSLMLLVFLRSIRDALMVLVPIVFAALVTAGSSVVLGLPLNFANIIALPLLVGVGVDSGIHMVHRMRTEPPSDGDPLHTSTSRAVFASALTTVASFGNLAFAAHLGMASMGQLLTLGMAMSLIAVLGLLPALMRLGKTA